MAEKLTIICPECAKTFKVPPEVVGRKIRCKSCGKAFVAKEAADLKLKEPKAKVDDSIIPLKDDDDDDGDGKPYEVTSVDLSARCPSCANELEHPDDVICLHCGFNLETRTVARTRKVKDVTGGDIFLWLLPGILAAVGFFLLMAWMISQIIYRFTYEPPTPQERSLVFENALNCCTIWTCILCIWGMYKTARFAIKRLIFENTPPEVEI